MKLLLKKSLLWIPLSFLLKSSSDSSSNTTSRDFDMPIGIKRELSRDNSLVHTSIVNEDVSSVEKFNQVMVQQKESKQKKIERIISTAKARKSRQSVKQVDVNPAAVELILRQLGGDDFERTQNRLKLIDFSISLLVLMNILVSVADTETCLSNTQNHVSQHLGQKTHC